MAISRKALNRDREAVAEITDAEEREASGMESGWVSVGSTRSIEKEAVEQGAERARLHGCTGTPRTAASTGARRESGYEGGAEPGKHEHLRAVRPAGLDKAGYLSPVYNVSREVRLDPGVVLANRCVAFQADAPELEFYRQLRTRILHATAGCEGATVMVTSALPGEGKTLTAINLALTFAREFRQTALLVDCDLRQQQIHKTLGFEGECGLVDYLMDGCPITDLFVWPGVDKLTVISGGKTVQESCELLTSPCMQDLVVEMKNRYAERYVIFDAPPVLSSADAIAFAPMVDYIVVVTQAGKTAANDLNRALELLPRQKVLGLVLNRC